MKTPPHSLRYYPSRLALPPRSPPRDSKPSVPSSETAHHVVERWAGSGARVSNTPVRRNQVSQQHADSMGMPSGTRLARLRGCAPAAALGEPCSLVLLTVLAVVYLRQTLRSLVYMVLLVLVVVQRRGGCGIASLLTFRSLLRPRRPWRCQTSLDRCH